VNKPDLPQGTKIEITLYIKVPGARTPYTGTTVLTSERPSVQFKYASDPVQRAAAHILERIWPQDVDI
jgi:hypothetical protein